MVWRPHARRVGAYSRAGTRVLACVLWGGPARRVAPRWVQARVLAGLAWCLCRRRLVRVWVGVFVGQWVGLVVVGCWRLPARRAAWVCRRALVFVWVGVCAGPGLLVGAGWSGA